MKALLETLSQRAIRLRLHGDRIAFIGPKGAMTTGLLRELRAHRDDLRDWLLLRGHDDSPAAPTTFDPEALLADAMRAEQQRDLGPDADAFVQALAVYAESVERDVRPHGLGRIYLYERIFKMSLAARLRLAKHLEPDQRPRRAPLIVCGIPRSGTTLLHRLLALADDAAALPLWQLLEPLPPGDGPDLRREHAERNLKWLASLVPVSLDAQHLVRPDLPDECGHLLRACFMGAIPWQAPAVSWLRWSLGADAAPAYRAWSAFVARLEPDDGRLVLKDPFHFANLEALLAVCPQARIVQTHRDPVECLPSFHKLALTMHRVIAPDVDVARVVEENTAWLETCVQRNAAQRAAVPADQLVDVDYRALVADPLAEVERIHDAFGLDFSPEHAARIRQWMQAHPQREHGENRYSPRDYGQSADEIAGRFADYRRRYQLGAQR